MIARQADIVPWFPVADDAGALLVRSGLVPASSLDEARSRVEHLGGTLGEQLVGTGAIEDDALTDFYRQRLLVPQVNPNTLARLAPKVVAAKWRHSAGVKPSKCSPAPIFKSLIASA